MENIPGVITTLKTESKIATLLKSRKFWALIAALVTIASGYFVGGVDAGTAVNQAIAALGTYMVATGIEDAKTLFSR